MSYKCDVEEVRDEKNVLRERKMYLIAMYNEEKELCPINPPVLFEHETYLGSTEREVKAYDREGILCRITHEKLINDKWRKHGNVQLYKEGILFRTIVFDNDQIVNVNDIN